MGQMRAKKMKQSAKSLLADLPNRLIKRNHDLERIVRLDMCNSLAHELGHYLVAKHFGLEPILRAWHTFEAARGDNKTIAGNCAFNRTTAFRKCCIGWSGELGNSIYYGETDAEDLVWRNFDLWECDRESYSTTDQEAIAGHPQVRRALKIAVGILVDRADEIRITVDDLVRRWAASEAEALEYSELGSTLGEQ